jgi:pyruvate dehydrogenase E2 component (dihydrolipoamide acetyltransferase)
MLPLTLAFDHRIINGAAAGRFLGFIKTLLENPFRICLY